MIQTELTVQNQLGLHARVASYIVRQAKTFSKIRKATFPT